MATLHAQNSAHRPLRFEVGELSEQLPILLGQGVLRGLLNIGSLSRLLRLLLNLRLRRRNSTGS